MLNINNSYYKNDLSKHYKNIYSKFDKIYTNYDVKQNHTKLPNYNFKLSDINSKKNNRSKNNGSHKKIHNDIFNKFEFYKNHWNEHNIIQQKYYNVNMNISFNDISNDVFNNIYKYMDPLTHNYSDTFSLENHNFQLNKTNMINSSLSNYKKIFSHNSEEIDVYKNINMMDNKNDQSNFLHCINCGKNNHFQKNCNYPITSFGIIAIKFDHNNNINFLMIQRKYSLGFVEFIRGKYDCDNIDTIIILIKQMVQTEIDMIKENISKFDILWQNLWRNSADKLIFTNEYKNSKEKFEKICFDENYFEKFIDTTLTYSDLEWGFPKGRKKKYEKNITCAIREFEEETNLTNNDYKIINNNPYEEIFYGTNSIKYKHVYYLAFLTTDKKFDNTNYNSFQLDEIANINIFNYTDTMNNIRPYYIERIKIIENINNFINNINVY